MTPEPYYADDLVTLYLGKCEDILPSLPAESVDAVVCDPPYDLTANKRGGSGAASLNEAHPAGRSRITTGGGFMGKEWDATGVAFKPETWRAVMRVMKPGAHLLAFGGSRTWHRMVCAIEDAGFEIRDPIADLTGMDAPGLLWIQGQGYPKNLDVSKAIDKAAGAEREVIGLKVYADGKPRTAGADDTKHEGYRRPWREEDPQRNERLTAPATEDAQQWQGWGTALKPAWEPVAVARKPFKGSVAQNVLTHGTGAFNLAACKVGTEARVNNAGGASSLQRVSRVEQGYRPTVTTSSNEDNEVEGRWPPNLVIGEAAAAELDRQSGVSVSRIGKPRQSAKPGDGYGMIHTGSEYADSGGASRFFPVFKYESKAPPSERPRLPDGTAWPTVKPLDFIRWLVRLVTPPGGIVLDPFCGSGTTAEACIVEGFRCIAIDRDPVALQLAMERLRKPIQPVLFGGEAS